MPSNSCRKTDLFSANCYFTRLHFAMFFSQVLSSPSVLGSRSWIRSRFGAVIFEATEGAAGLRENLCNTFSSHMCLHDGVRTHNMKFERHGNYGGD